MKTQRLTTYFFGHKVEVTLALSEEHDKPYVSVPRSVMDLSLIHISEPTRP